MDVNVLCARVRVEEKRLIEALAKAGVTATPTPPSQSPLPLCPVAPKGAAGRFHQILIDRCTDRVLAGAVLPMLEASGVSVIGAGVACCMNRLQIASRLAASGLPRPATMLTTSEDVALVAFDQLDRAATFLPLDFAKSGIALQDRDIAEAVLEHREVMGASEEIVGLMQAGIATSHSLTSVLAVGGRAAAFSGQRSSSAFALAERAALALNADLIAIEIISTSAELQIWDVRPVPDFREMTPIGVIAAEDAIAALVARRVAELDRGQLVLSGLETIAGEVECGLALSA